MSKDSRSPVGARAATGNGNGNDADTYGWDTAFAINFTNANTAITEAWPNVNSGAKNLVQQASDDPTYNINAVLGPWQFTVGGDGKNIRMACPVVSGVYNAGGDGTIQFDGKNCEIVIEIGMEWVPDPDQFSFVISDQAKVDTIKADLDNNTIDSTLQQEFSANNMPLSSDAVARVQTAGEEWLITDGTPSFYIFHSTDKYNNEFLNVYQFEKAWLNDLQALQAAASEDEPAVSIITIVNNPATGIAAAVLPDLLSTWFNANIAEFNHVFASLDLTPLVSADDKYAWMKPTATSYAVTDQGTMDSSVFGVLTMALGNPPSDNHQVSPYAIPAAPAQAGFLISGPMFMQNMMLPGAMAIFNNAPASSFDIDNDGLTVRNNTDLVWGKFMMDNNQQGSVPDNGYSAQLDQGILPDDLVNDLTMIGVMVQGYSVSVTDAGSQWLLSTQDGSAYEYILNLDGSNIDVYLATVVTIAKGNFTMTLVHSYIEIEFTDLVYPYSSSYDVHADYTEQVTLELQTLDGNQVFWADPVTQKSLVVNVTKTQSAITREIVEGAVTAVLSLVAIAGPIIEGLQAGTEITELSEDAGQGMIEMKTFSQVLNENPEATEQDALEAGSNAADQSSGKLTNIKNAFGTPMWKFVATLAALSGAVVGGDQAISAIIENAVTKQWQNVPGFDDFANAAIVPYTWPSVSGYTLQSASLAGSLQIGLTVDQ
ncbi:TULIP family P47-like protein [Actinoallomurus purpureus]|uniref:TULIP family P47-like protein n=1 Tax=Actinoallomurus purpureus TaxID=478114 RepID=UPI002092F953|nr:TULIP family P47-like protein [Actinoallomurus purpureus]MCO6010408.1 TULIP family P47-like protein [Actinoallomurus purpureus]